MFKRFFSMNLSVFVQNHSILMVASELTLPQSWLMPNSNSIKENLKNKQNFVLLSLRLCSIR